MFTNGCGRELKSIIYLGAGAKELSWLIRSGLITHPEIYWHSGPVLHFPDLHCQWYYCSLTSSKAHPHALFQPFPIDLYLGEERILVMSLFALKWRILVHWLFALVY